MNNKHLACGLVALFVLGLIQTTLWAQNVRTKMQREAAAAAQSESDAAAVLAREKGNLDDLRSRSKTLVTFLRTWQPFFETFRNAQSAEANFTVRIKESGLVNLSQRFESADNKGIPSIPSSLRAILTFEDDYARVLNWLGTVETTMPTVRVTSVKLAKGTRPNDVRMELILDQPIMR